MFDVPIIMVGIVVCTYILSKADIKIAINHTHKDLTIPAPTFVKKEMTPEEVEELIKEQSKTPTFDDVLHAIQIAVGGTDEE